MKRRPTDGAAEVQLDVHPDRHLSYVIAKVSHQLELAIDRALATQGVTVTQFSALAHVARSPGLSSAGLARALLTTPQATTTLVRRLVDAGLVERPDTDPGLASTIRLTAHGLRKLKTAEKVATSAEDRAFSTLASAEQHRLATTLKTLLAELEQRNVNAPG